MVHDICFHIFDLVQNSVSAGASRIVISIFDSIFADRLEIELSDNGRGMDQETAARIQDPFYTTKSHKKVGLGVPLFKQTALHCQGSFSIDSVPGQGTSVKAVFRRLHIDLPPMGDLEDAVLSLATTLGEVDLLFSYRNDLGEFQLDTAELREHAGGLPLWHPEIRSFLQAYIEENLAGLRRGQVAVEKTKTPGLE